MLERAHLHRRASCRWRAGDEPRHCREAAPRQTSHLQEYSHRVDPGAAGGHRGHDPRSRQLEAAGARAMQLDGIH